MLYALSRKFLQLTKLHMAINKGGQTSLPQKLNTQLTLVRNVRMLQGQEAVNVTKRRNKSIPKKTELAADTSEG